MLEKLARDSAVRLFGAVAWLGIHRLPGFDRLFLAAYALYKRHFEAGPIERLREFVPNGSVVIDVGANVGFFASRFAHWVGRGEVIAIEPEEHNYRILIASLRRKRLLARVRALKAVAAATSGTMLLEINQAHPADHKLSVDGTGIPVDAVRLDDLVENKGAQRPSLIKIDVQGAEMLVLRGAADILKLSGPALFVELSDQALGKFGSSISAVINHLSQQGYASYWLAPAGPHRRADFAEIHAKAEHNGYVDVLFLKSA